ncbi:hypothetical protein SPD48_14450 [Pseudogracilibacillus sp. SE30717A]|uniref:hypothetical protein n=1 Tax=Pseudogracilibacillus sp. SE30717A TaxID=3098293 RepID=UPI00300E626F
MYNEEVKYIEVFVLEDFNDRGNSMSKGLIYEIEKSYAEMYINEGKVIEVKNTKLDRIKKDVEDLYYKLQSDIKSIKENPRLSEQAKEEDIEALELVFQAESESLQELYTKQIENLIQDLEREINELPSNIGDIHSARTQAGIITASLVVENEFLSAVDSLKQQIRVIDNLVARELLANFLNIKTELDTKMKGDSITEKTREGLEIREIYDMLLDKSYTEEQKRKKVELDLLYAIQRHSSNILDTSFRIREIVKGVIN